ncbi:restriction endonuclease subunit S [Enterococcus faecium]|uniref:restriction endonuclease subunit S n=1 Tax=Bacilli TaxID=91061 RepID=UPI0005C52365|nr:MULTISPECIES: restriction endonuclease subunit S [Bacilli]EME3538945.1 restriction endonuclease subunit S [Enterococcus faecium]EMF0416450.1 restriction endonuclease subunit S [Enterococcus faecium]KNC03961.1 restriction endonuclease subunit S [Enterococcus faecium]MDQ8428028.1 restriction endonuclease subunit S [Enterococcus faecium]
MSNDIQPEIRFPGFTEDWEERKLSEMANFSKGNGYSKADLAEEGHPVILYGRLYTKYETIIENVDTFAELKEKSVISNGGEVIVPASGETPEDISRASVVDVSGVALGGDLNIIKTKSELDPIFLALTISNGSQQKEMTKRAQGKSVVHLHNSDLKEVNLLYPKLDEQVKIGSFFKKLDVSIALHQRKLDLLKETKKGFLQKMFPKNGAKVPEIRFPGFTEDWEQRTLGDILKEFSIKSKVENEYTVLSSTNSGMEIRNGRVSGVSNLGYKIIENGDLVLSPQNLWLGNININNVGTGLVSPSYKTFKFIKVDPGFIRPQLRTARMLEEYKNSSTQGASVVRRNLELGSFYQITIKIPSDVEQGKIGLFFKQLDNLIALHQRKLDLLKETKKGFLQKMFV